MSHRLKLTFDGYLHGELICPEDRSGCIADCPACHARLADPDSKRCPSCEEVMAFEECWLASWFGAIDVEDVLAGEIEFPISVEVNEDGSPLCTIEMVGGGEQGG